MNVVYRILAAVLAVLSGVVIAGLVLALTEGDDVDTLWFVVFALGAFAAVGAAVVLWARAGGR